MFLVLIFVLSSSTCSCLLDDFHLAGKSGLVSCAPRLRWGNVVNPKVGFESVRVKDGVLVLPYARSESGSEGLVEHSGG